MTVAGAPTPAAPVRNPPTKRVPADLLERDPDYIERSLRFTWPLIAAWFRPEIRMFLTRGQRIARALRLDRRFRLKVLPVSLALPWGLDVGDLFGHIPLPAKITVQVLEPIDIRERLRPTADVDAVYASVTTIMQETLDELAAERRWPVIG